MKYTIIPNTTLKVSKICLGTMTFGEQNSEKEAHKQIDYATEQGVNFIDTAEMYSVPGRAETQGSTEKIIGTWIKNNDREKVILATKVAGPNRSLEYIRKNLGFSKKAITEALNKSLKRLQTDYIDLYQLHWPERKTNCFGIRNFTYDSSDVWVDNFKEVLETLNNFVKEGKIRHFGVSNETAWGLMHYLNEAKINNLPKPITIQNPYSLLNRTFEIGLAEVAIRENIGLLAYSPLAFGILSGKYMNAMPKNSRLNLFPQMGRYNSEESRRATQQYATLAKKYELNFTQMALAFINQQHFLTSTIIGATTMEQLKENIESIDVVLTNEILKEINDIQNFQPNPAP